VLIGVAQEKVNGFRTYQKNRRTRQQRRDGKPLMFSFYRGAIDVNQYYFYLLDRDFGLCFIKFSSYHRSTSGSGSRATSGRSGNSTMAVSRTKHSTTASCPRHRPRREAVGVAYLLDTCALSEFTKPKPSVSVDVWFAKIPEGAHFVSVLAVTRNTSDIARTGAPITDPW
jgi:hypothetical protein